MKFREHRGGYAESMATVIELPDRAALVAHVQKLLALYPGALLVTNERLRVEKYIFDARNGWHTHIVTLDGYGVLGFTNGPVRASIGEGFAYFAWHRLRWPSWDDCRGIRDGRVCELYWHSGRR